jgi:hypothetical protein
MSELGVPGVVLQLMLGGGSGSSWPWQRDHEVLKLLQGLRLGH